MGALRDIAADMEGEAQRRGTSVRELSRGLRLQLNRVGGFNTLTLSRPVVEPSEQEIAICRQAFGVPADAQRLDGVFSVQLRWPA